MFFSPGKLRTPWGQEPFIFLSPLPNTISILYAKENVTEDVFLLYLQHTTYETLFSAIIYLPEQFFIVK